MLGFYLSLLDTAEEKSKFEELYITYKQDMFKMAMGILKSDFEAEDAVHEAFMIVVKKLSKISQINCPSTHAYLLIIVKNIALKMLKQKKREVADSGSLLGVVDDTDIENEIISRLSVEELEIILRKLPEDYYNVLFMKMYMDFNISDIAESLGITYENAKKRLSRAKNKFKEILEEQEDYAAKS